MKVLFFLIIIAGCISYYAVTSKTKPSELERAVRVKTFKQNKKAITEVFKKYNQINKKEGQQKTINNSHAVSPPVVNEPEYGRQIDLSSIYELDKIEDQDELYTVKKRVTEILLANPDEISQVLNDFGELTGELERHVGDIINDLNLKEEHLDDLSQFLFISEIKFEVDVDNIDQDVSYEVYFEKLQWGLNLLSRKFQPSQYESVKNDLLDFYQENPRASFMVTNGLQ